MTVKKFLVSLYIIILSLQPIAFAEELLETTVADPTPSTLPSPSTLESSLPESTPDLNNQPEASSSPTPSPTASPKIEESPVPSSTPTLTIADSVATPSSEPGEDSSAVSMIDQTATDSATSASSSVPPLPETKTISTASVSSTVSADNTVDVNNSVAATSSSGQNEITSAEEASISSGTTQTQTTTVNEVNTTIIGENTTYAVATVTDPHQQLELPTAISPCSQALPWDETSTQQSQTEQIAISNQAAISNNQTVTSDSGSNSIEALKGDIATGDASAEAQVANIANTSLIGDCWFYGVITLFTPYTTTILIPNEEQFLKYAQPSSQAGSGNSLTINTDNIATVSSQVQSTTNTGENQTIGGEQITTGSSTQSVEEITSANTTIIEDAWVLIKIVNPQYWLGSFSNGLGTTFMHNNDLYYWLPWNTPSLVTAYGTQQRDISITNFADVENNLELTANTGNNNLTTKSGSITTGNALTAAEILNLLNTTVIGNNWYFLTLNLFDEFSGNVEFARPDMVIAGPKKVTVNPGTTTTLSIGVMNAGTAVASQIRLSESAPSNWQVSSNQLIATQLLPQQSQIFPVTLNIPTSVEVGEYALSLTVSNDLTESTLDNNQLTIPISVTVVSDSEQQNASTKITENKLLTSTSVNQLSSVRPNQHSRSKIANSIQRTHQTVSPTQTILGATTSGFDTNSKLEVKLPFPLGGTFCKKYWEVCTAGAMLLTTAPLKAWERRRKWWHLPHLPLSSS